MIDPLPASGWLSHAATGYDANIPRGLRGQTGVVSVWAVTLQFSAFLVLVVLPLVTRIFSWHKRGIVGTRRHGRSDVLNRSGFGRDSII